MTQDQLMGLVRQVLPFLAGMAVAKGWVTATQASDIMVLVMQITGPILVVGGSVWAFVANSKKSIISSAAAMPEVSGVVTMPTVAGKAMAESVTAPGAAVAAAGTASAAAIASK